MNFLTSAPLPEIKSPSPMLADASRWNAVMEGVTGAVAGFGGGAILGIDLGGVTVGLGCAIIAAPLLGFIIAKRSR